MHSSLEFDFSDVFAFIPCFSPTSIPLSLVQINDIFKSNQTYIIPFNLSLKALTGSPEAQEWRKY